MRSTEVDLRSARTACWRGWLLWPFLAQRLASIGIEASGAECPFAHRELTPSVAENGASDSPADQDRPRQD
jgi:hypothetical protein